MPSPDDTGQDDVHGYRVRGTEGVTEYSTLPEVGTRHDKPWPCGYRHGEAVSASSNSHVRPLSPSLGLPGGARRHGRPFGGSGRDRVP